MKLCIAGSRNIQLAPLMIDFYLSQSGIDKSSVNELVCGMAKGVDQSGLAWAVDNKIQIAAFPADWDKHHKAAGHIRNKEMAEDCDCALIFWDGISPGTKNMMENLDRLNKPYYVVIVNAIGWKTKL